MGPNNAVQSAQDVMNVIINATLSEKLRNRDYHGISIFLPDDARWYKTSYETLDFSGDTEWAEFIKILYGI